MVKKDAEKKTSKSFPAKEIEKVKVIRAKSWNDENTQISFDAIFNDCVTIYNLRAVDLVNGKTGETFTKINFPSYKGSDGNYYSYAFCRLNDKLKENILSQIEKLI